MGKLHYLTALLLIILLAIASGWIFESMDNDLTLTKKKLRHEPDYFLKNFKATTMDDSGKPAYTVKAQLLNHYPDNNSMQLQKPLLTFYDNNVKAWTAKSNEALIIDNSNVIQLNGNVILNQVLNNKTKNKPIILMAEQLTIETKKNIAHTKSKIKLIKGDNTIQAVGMRADMKNSRIEFLSRTRSHYVLPAK